MPKKKGPKFPRLIHLVREEGTDGSHWFAVHEHGVVDMDEHGEPVAIYKLASVGLVRIQKAYIEQTSHVRR